MLKKKCLYCENIIIKSKSVSLKKWNDQTKYCCKSCADKARIGKATWNKGLKGMQESWNKGTKGLQVAWNKGLKGVGENKENGMWKGTRVGYHALHSWVRRKFNFPKKCTECGKENCKIEMANVDHKYSRELKDYIPLCTKCHRLMDKENNLWRYKTI